MLSCDQLVSGTVDLQVGDIIVAKSGARNAPVGLGADLKPLRLVLAKTPSLTTPFVPSAYDGGDRVSLDLRAFGRVEQAMDLLDSWLMGSVIQHKDKYFKKPPSDAELEQYYTPLKKWRATRSMPTPSDVR